MTNKLVFFVSTDRYFLSHRINLAAEAQKKNFDVYLITTVTSNAYENEIKRNNIKIINIRLHRSSTMIFPEILFLNKLYKEFRILKPDIIHNVALKPVIYGSILGKLCGIKNIVNAIAGTGIVFSSKKKSKKFLKYMLKIFLYLALKKTKVIIQNKSDKKFIKGLIRNDSLISHQNGVGVNLASYIKKNSKTKPSRILLASRILWSKGIGDYIKAIRIIKKKRNDLKFLIAGSPDLENPDHIDEQMIRDWEAEGLIKYLGWVENMPKLLSEVDIFCLPTFYGEGMPKSLIEATAAGVPSITTDTPGCNEIILNNKNGFLVPINSPKEIADKIEYLIENTKLYAKMTDACRDIAVNKFDENKIIKETLELYG